MAVNDLLRGRALDDVVDQLPELWENCLRVRDDIKVRLKLVHVLSYVIKKGFWLGSLNATFNNILIKSLQSSFSLVEELELLGESRQTSVSQ